MRSIRAWDDELQEMLYSKIEQFDDSLSFRFSKHFETENPIYMESTGLKDKNSNELYVNDIVKHRKLGGQEISVGIVSISPIQGVLIGNWPIGFDWEVLGNRYENPDLLKVKE